MEKNTNRDYTSKEAHNPREQLLSYFESHINKYPDGPKSSEEMEVLAPNPNELYQDDEDDANTEEEKDDEANPHFDDDYEEGYKLMVSNKDDFTESGYEGL